MQKLKNAVARFMYGRYGMDQLNMTLVWVGIATGIAELILYRKTEEVNILLEIFSTFSYVFFFIRCFSKNVYKRQNENHWFCNHFYWPIQREVKNCKQRLGDKDHKYFVCKNCHTMCRVPKGKGKVIITCPKCHNQIHGKS